MAKKNMETLNITPTKTTKQPLGNGRFVTIEVFPIKQLIDNPEKYVVHGSVQRGLDTTYVKRLSNGLLNTTDILSFTPLNVMLAFQTEDGNYHIFDGQHRLNAIKRAYAAEKEQIDEYAADLAHYNELVQQREQMTADAADGVPLPPKPVEYTMSPTCEVMLNSPITMMTYSGAFTEVECRELFCAANQGKVVQRNLLSTFSSANSELVEVLGSKGWIGTYLEDKKGCNSAIFGVKDVVTTVTKAGGLPEVPEQTTTAAVLTFLEVLFGYTSAVDAEKREYLKERGLYREDAKPFSATTLGGSTRTLMAVAKLLSVVDEKAQHKVAKHVADLIGTHLLQAPEQVNVLIPVYNQTKAGGYKLTTATTVERMVFFWLLGAVLQYDDVEAATISLPKRFTANIEKIEGDYNYALSYPWMTEQLPYADLVELFYSLLPTPKVTSKQVQVKHEAPDLSAEQEAELAQLAQGVIDL